MHDFIYRAIWLQVVLLAIGVPALFVVFLAGRRQPGAGEEQPFNGLLRKKAGFAPLRKSDGWDRWTQSKRCSHTGTPKTQMSVISVSIIQPPVRMAQS